MTAALRRELGKQAGDAVEVRLLERLDRAGGGSQHGGRLGDDS